MWSQAGAPELPTPLESMLASARAIPWQDYLWSIGVVVLSTLVGIVSARLVLRAVRRWAAHTESHFDDLVLARLSGPLTVLVPLGMVTLLLPLAVLPERPVAVIRHGLGIAFILCAAWLLRRVVLVVEQVIVRQFDIAAADNLRARQVVTQMHTLRNVASFLIVVLALSLALMTFSQVRQIGMSLLASAGVAGIIVGFAAQRSIATLIAGIQIAVTQPIRVDDVVIVEGEWGRIEEITLTYVVVRIWDLRRLVLPITYFIEKPFQNWTRTSADLLGAVSLHVDYTIPVEEVRRELERIVRDNEKWDGNLVSLQVIGTTERTMELRALVSAPDAGTAWGLRCDIRERLIGYVQERFPQCLPRVRGSLQGGTATPTSDERKRPERHSNESSA